MIGSCATVYSPPSFQEQVGAVCAHPRTLARHRRRWLRGEVHPLVPTCQHACTHTQMSPPYTPALVRAGVIFRCPLCHLCSYLCTVRAYWAQTPLVAHAITPRSRGAHCKLRETPKNEKKKVRAENSGLKLLHSCLAHRAPSIHKCSFGGNHGGDPPSVCCPVCACVCV